jgi:UDP-galactopyranose mutase
VSRSTLIAYSHVRWDDPDPRPRQVFLRLAASRRILFVEEPVGGALNDSWERLEKGRNLVVHRPHMAGEVRGFEPSHAHRMARLLEELVATEAVGRHTAWLSTPLAYLPAQSLAPEIIVYDCITELDALPEPRDEAAGLEARLLRSANLVFAGGPGLFRARKERHPNVHYLPRSVDVAHFRRGRAGQPVAAEYDSIPSPRLGYFGTLDDRVDLELLEAVAGAHPTWQLVLVGPLAGLERSDLPRLPNVRYLGARTDSEAPRHLAAWDLSLLPYRLGERTREFSPPRTLELMAAEHPIVSTPLADVAGPYEDIVYLGEGASGFLQACERALASTPEDRAGRTAHMRELLAHTSWERAVRRIEDELRQVEGPLEQYGRTLELSLAGLLRVRA